MSRSGWYSRPVAALCAVAALASISLALIGRSGGARAFAEREGSFFVTIRQYGVDAREMERTVAVPLEDEFTAIPGAFDVRTVSEYGKVRASLRFRYGAGAYDSVREAAQRVYERLPSSAQRPEIGSSSEQRIPVWVAAVTAEGDLDRLMEKEIKPAFERIEGVGEVEVGGTGVPETRVLVREESAASVFLDPAAVASFLAANDGLFPSGTVRTAEEEFVSLSDARFRTDNELRKALIPSGGGVPVPLCSIASVESGARKSESRSRVNGNPSAVVSVIPSSGADTIRVSRSLNEALKRFPHARFRLLSDRGAEAASSYRSVLLAAAQGLAAVAAATALIARGAGFRFAAAGAFSVPFTLLGAAALLSAFGFALDRVVLAGLAAGLGAAVDAAILTVERIGKAENEIEKRRLMDALSPSLLSGAATTLIVLIPLFSMDSFAPGSAALAFAVGSTTTVALISAFLLLPPFLGRSAPRVEPRRASGRTWLAYALFSRVARGARRLLARNAAFCARRPFVPLAAALAISCAAVVSLLIAGVDVGSGEEGNSIYVHIEAESGATMESVDERLASWSRSILELDGVVDAQTSARPGSGSAVVSFDPTKTDRRRLTEKLRSTRVPGAFVFLPQTAQRERFWKITVSGDDDRVCRETASRAAARLGSFPFIAETVLNFKDGPDRLLLTPNREKLAATGLDFAHVADALRRSVHGPVAYKRVTAEGESDVRVGGSKAENCGAEELSSLILIGSSLPVRLGSVIDERREKDVGRIERADRRRQASLTIRTAAMDPRRARVLVDHALSGFETPPLYSVEFDREAIEAARRLSRSAWNLIAAVVLSYMALAALTESFGAPLAALAAVPPALAVPLLASTLAHGGLNGAAAAAFVAVSGVAVNASVLTVEERRSGGPRLPGAGARDVYRLTRSRAASLAATCGTTVAGAAPLLFLSDPLNASARALAFVTVLGTAASFVASLTVVPALAVLAPRLFDTWHLSVESFRLGLKQKEENRNQP